MQEVFERTANEIGLKSIVKHVLNIWDWISCHPVIFTDTCGWTAVLKLKKFVLLSVLSLLVLSG